MKKDIVIFAARGPITTPIIVSGGETPMLDDDKLIIMGAEGSYLTFNWDNVLYYGVSDHDHDCEEHAHV